MFLFFGLFACLCFGGGLSPFSLFYDGMNYDGVVGGGSDLFSFE